MFEASQPSTSKAAKFNTLSGNGGNSDIEMDNVEDNEDGSSLWCIEDDTLFYAQGLKHHSAGKGKSVYVTWNENYLLNFVFKTSSTTGTTTLTKVRISMPIHNQQQEEISNMLILEMNTLLYMKSGRIYYFSSVKSMHKVEWLSGIRCVSSCPLTQFSVIRLLKTSDQDKLNEKKKLCLEVYKDVPQIGKCFSNDVLMRSYDITFDAENLFNCNWLDETYTLTSLIANEKNVNYLQQLLSIGNTFRSQEEAMDLSVNQEIHIFTISGNIFLLTGAIVSEDESISSNTEVRNFSIRLLNTYACSIECIRVDCERNLLIVLLQSGHLDVWYKSDRMFGAFLHSHHEISQFLDYDFWPSENIFYFTTPEEVIQLKILTRIGVEKECVVKEVRKNIGGMIACTFVEGLQQLICLSVNNIFYRINFSTQPENLEIPNENEIKYENLNKIYALNDKRLSELLYKAQIVDELMEQPKYFHNAIEKEFGKQQVLALESKSGIFKKLFRCHLEYHTCLPGREYFDNDYIHIKTNLHSIQPNTQSIFCLIFVSLKNNKNNFLSSVFTATNWYMHISYLGKCLQLYVPYQILNKKLCFVVDIPVSQSLRKIHRNFSLNLITFFNHQYQSICLKCNLCIDTNEKTYVNLFSGNIQSILIFRNSLDDVKNLLVNQIKRPLYCNKSSKCVEIVNKIKQSCKVRKSVLQNIMKNLKATTPLSIGMNFTLYYLQQYLIELNYDDTNEILLINSNYPEAVFYIKLLLIYELQSYDDCEAVNTIAGNWQQLIINYQNDIEHLYGSLISEPNKINCNTMSMHLEKLRRVYLKLRIEFHDIFR